MKDERTFRPEPERERERERADDNEPLKKYVSK